MGDISGMKTILVTGGTGFIGANLCRRLIADGHRIICLDNNYTGSLDKGLDLTIAYFRRKLGL